ncbi:MAG TPA: hypothetical protein VFF58_00470 [Candidatus Nitrosotalea sp.]|nr:hypothetical protein [Candidatus Nitrosotalea sp.]
MTLPTERAFPSGRVGVEECGDPASPQNGIAVLDPRVEFMRYCPHCDEERQFIAAWFSLEGLIGRCLWCGTPALAVYTRANSEAA